MRQNQLEREVAVEPKAMADGIGRTPWRAPVITRIALARTLNTTGSPHDAFTSGTHA